MASGDDQSWYEYFWGGNPVESAVENVSEDYKEITDNMSETSENVAKGFESVADSVARVTTFATVGTIVIGGIIVGKYLGADEVLKEGFGLAKDGVSAIRKSLK